MNILKIYPMFGDVEIPSFSTGGSACMDIKAYLKGDNRTVAAYTNTNKPINSMVLQDNTESPLYVNLYPEERMLIPTGIILDIPAGYSVRVHPRSGLSFKSGITLANCEGVIDWDYTQQLFVCMINTSALPVKICHGDRIAQLEMIKSETYNIETITSPPQQKTNRNGGLGSTGV